MPSATDGDSEERTGRSLVLRILGTFFSRAALLIISATVSIIVARVVGPSDRGLYVLALAVVGFGVQFGDLGLRPSNLYLAARNHGLAGRLAANSLVVSATTAGLAIPIIWSALRITSTLPAELAIPASILVPLTLLRTQTQQIALGLERIRLYNCLEIGQQLLTVSLILGLAWSTVVTPSRLLAIAVAIELAGIALLLGILLRGTAGARPDAGLFRESISYGARAYVTTLMSGLVLRSDLLMLKHLSLDKSPDHEVGLYSVAMSIAMMLQLLPTTIGPILFARLCTMSDRRERFRLARNGIVAVAVTVGPMIALMMMYSRDVVRLLYGSAYEEAAAALFWLLPGVLVWGIEGIGRKLLTSDGFDTRVIAAWALAAAVNILLNFLLIPPYGIRGAAIASSLAFVVVAIVTGPSIWSRRR